MELLTGIMYPPNRPFERDMRPSQVPVLYNFLFFIETNAKGEIIVGCSNVAGIYWEGTLLHYKDFQSALENKYSSYYISRSTTSDAKFIENDCILLAEDSGSLKLVNLSNLDVPQVMECRDSYDKENRVIQLSVWNINKFASCTEQTINLYNTANGSAIVFDRNYRNYHTDRITSIDTNKLDNNLFISTSADRKACLWDIRMDIAATVIYNNEFSSLTAGSWNSSNKDQFVVGNEAGDIYLLDIKQPKDVLSVSHCFDSSVNRICFDDSGSLAVCGNTTKILIYDCKNEQLEKSSESNKHDSIVKGLTWYKNTLYSCGFNKNIASHCC